MANPKEEVQQLKRQGRYSETIPILRTMIDGDGGRDWFPDWPYQQAAIAYRKLKDIDAEIALLEEYASRSKFCRPSEIKLYQRLLKAYALAGMVRTELVGEGEVNLHKDLQVPLEELPFFLGVASVLDTETTGLSHQDELIELGLVTFQYNKLTGEVLERVEEYSGLQQPSVPIARAATKVHGLRSADLKGQEIDKGRVGKLLMNSDVLISHNAAFDRRFVEKAIPDTEAQTWACSLHGIPWPSEVLPSRRLQDLLVAHDIEVMRDHRAFDDAQALLLLLQKMNPETQNRYFHDLLQGGPLRPPARRSTPTEVSFETPDGATISISTEMLQEAIAEADEKTVGRKGCSLVLVALAVLVLCLSL